MAGNKNSGRKHGALTNFETALRQRVLNKSWAILETTLDNPNADKKDKLEIAKALAGRNIPQQVDATVDANITEMQPIQKDNRIDSFLIGAPLDAPKL